MPNKPRKMEAIWQSYMRKRKGFTTDGIEINVEQAMAALWVEKHKDDNDRTHL